MTRRIVFPFGATGDNRRLAGGARKVLTPGYRRFKRAVFMYARSQYSSGLFLETVQVRIVLGKRCERFDVLGFSKPVLDGLEGVFYRNDRSVRKCSAEYAADCGESVEYFAVEVSDAARKNRKSYGPANPLTVI